MEEINAQIRRADAGCVGDLGRLLEGEAGHGRESNTWNVGMLDSAVPRGELAMIGGPLLAT